MLLLRQLEGELQCNSGCCQVNCGSFRIASVDLLCRASMVDWINYLRSKIGMASRGFLCTVHPFRSVTLVLRVPIR